MENKSEGNENKIILGYFDCIMDKIDRDGGNKTQRLCRCGSNYALSKFTMYNGLDSSEFTHCSKFSGTRSRIDIVYTDIKIPNNTKINHIMVFFTDHYNSMSLDRIPLNTKIRKD